jgi:hypothetical protein
LNVSSESSKRNIKGSSACVLSLLLRMVLRPSHPLVARLWLQLLNTAAAQFSTTRPVLRGTSVVVVQFPRVPQLLVIVVEALGLQRLMTPLQREVQRDGKPGADAGQV